MKNATAHARKLRGLLRRVKAADPVAPAMHTLLDHLIYASLAHDATRRQAAAAYQTLMRVMVDYNDLRVSDPQEIIRAIGENYPLAGERVLRLREMLHAVYLREHTMDLLAALQKASKRDARTYLDGLAGMTPFVSASIVLLGLDGHAIPVDGLLMNKLRRDGIIDKQASVAEVEAFLAHQIKASDAIKAHHILRTFAETGGTPRRAAATKTTQKPTKTKTVKKPTSSKKPTKKKVTKKR